MGKPWSYSSIKTFSQCAKKYYHLKVAEDVHEPGNVFTDYGSKFHKAAEDYVLGECDLDPKFSFAADVLNVIKRIRGEKFCEYKMGIVKDGDTYDPCGFDNPDAWWRGIVDVLIVDGDSAVLLDYKTGKSSRYADLKQIDLMAAATFVYFPEVQKIKGGLAFVVANELVSRTYRKDQLQDYFSVFDDELARLEMAHVSNVWNPTSSGLCRYCPVVSCAHNPKR